MKRPSKISGTSAQWRNYQNWLADRALSAIQKLSKWGGRLFVLEVFREWMDESSWIDKQWREKRVEKKRKNRRKR